MWLRKQDMILLLTVLFLTIVPVCSITTAETITIVVFNDFHGIVQESEKSIGMVRFVGAVRQIRNERPNVIVVSGGDNYQGSAMSNLTYGLPVNDMFRLIGLELSVIGNHEFDWGTDLIAGWSHEGGFTFVAANIIDKKTSGPVPWAKPYKIIERSGVTIAFIGLTTIETPSSTGVDNVENLTFLPAYESASHWISQLTSGTDGPRPDFIILLTHISSFQDRETGDITGYELEPLLQLDGVDAITTAHSHQFVCGQRNGKTIVQAGSYGKALAVLSIDTESRQITPSLDIISEHMGTIPRYDDAVKIFASHELKLKPIIAEQIGMATADIVHHKDTSSITPLGKFVCEAIRSLFAIDAVIINGGSIRRTIYRGPITVGDIYEVLPFDDAVVLITVSGHELRKLLEHGINNEYIAEGQYAGIKLKADIKRPQGQRITSLKIQKGTFFGLFTRWCPVKEKSLYRIAVNEFMYAGGRESGGDGYDFSQATNPLYSGIPVRDVLISAIRTKKIISP